MHFSFRQAERIRRHVARSGLVRRPDELLPFVETQGVAGAELLLDTCVYVDRMQGKLPTRVKDLLDTRIVNHSMVAVQELLHAVGALDPHDERSDKAIAAIRTVIDAMRPHRTVVPDAATLGEAAVYAGVLCRIQGYAKDDRMRALHDCVLFLQTMKLGLTLLTRNLSDFDLLLQLRPDGRVLFYRT